MDSSGIYMANLILNCILAAITLYLLAAFLFYEYTHHHNSNSRGTNELHNKIARTLRVLCSVGMGFAFFHHICEIVSPFVASEKACQAMGTMWLLTYALGVLTTYVFLWQRQRWLYASPALKHLLNRGIKVFSWIVLVFLVISAVMLFLAGSRMIFFSSCDSTSAHGRRQLYQTILSATLLTLTVAGQTQLLILFLIPLKSHAAHTKKALGPNQNTPELSSTPHDTGNSQHSPPHRPTTPGAPRKENSSSGIFTLARRCMILASLNMLSDVVAAVVTIFVEHAAGKIVYDMNILISVMCCLGSFKTWARLIFPWKRTRSAQRRQEQLASVRCMYRNTDTSMSV